MSHSLDMENIVLQHRAYVGVYSVVSYLYVWYGFAGPPWWEAQVAFSKQPFSAEWIMDISSSNLAIVTDLSSDSEQYTKTKNQKVQTRKRLILIRR